MVVVHLREAMDRYKAATGEKLTYQILSERTGVSANTLQSLAARPDYNTTLRTIEKLCIALSCTPGDLLSLESSVQTDAD